MNNDAAPATARSTFPDAREANRWTRPFNQIGSSVGMLRIEDAEHVGDTVETRMQHNEAVTDQRFFTRAGGKVNVDRRITAIAIREAAPPPADISMEELIASAEKIPLSSVPALLADIRVSCRWAWGAACIGWRRPSEVQSRMWTTASLTSLHRVSVRALVEEQTPNFSPYT